MIGPETELETIKRNLPTLLTTAAEFTRVCRNCDELLYFVPTGHGGYVPFDSTAANHVTRCVHTPHRATFQRLVRR